MWLSLLLPLAFAATAAAQVRKGAFEISPFAGYIFGGDYLENDGPDFGRDVEADDAASYGLRLGYNVTRHFGLELQVSRTDSELLRDESDDRFGEGFGDSLGDLTLDYGLASFVWHIGSGRVAPYLTLGGGVTKIEAEAGNGSGDVEDEFRLTGSIGLGAKAYITKAIGLRFEGRGYGTSLPRDGVVGSCNPSFDSCSDTSRDWLINGEVSGGLVLAF